MNITVQILGSGTSQGVPVISCECEVCQSLNIHDKRLRSSILISSKNTNIVVDCTPDFRQQMLTANVKQLDAIVFSHEHQDHIGGLDDVRAYNFTQNRAMDIWVTPQVLGRLMQMFDYAFADNKYPGVPKIESHIISNHDFVIGDLSIKPIFALHGKLPVTGFRVGNFTYLTDVNHVPEKEMKKVMGSKVVMISALKKGKHHSHFSLPEAIDFINESGAERGYLTHISHHMGLHKEVENELPQHIKMVYDGMKLEVE